MTAHIDLTKFISMIWITLMFWNNLPKKQDGGLLSRSGWGLGKLSFGVGSKDSVV